MIWRPFTQEKICPPSIEIQRGEGAYLYDKSGKKYLDLISSWWVNIHGHANREIADAIFKQSTTLEHVIFAGFSHDPAQKLVMDLKKVTHPELCHYFFSDDGSTAVEIALKMVYQFFVNIGIKTRNIFINLNGAYHGDTLGAMSASGKSSIYHKTFSNFFFETFSIDFPDDQITEDEAIYNLKLFLEKKGENVCGFIVEPLVQGAAGMRVYRPEFLEKVVEEIRKYEIPVIFDEVMTGFYRTGTIFAMNQTKIIPDIICISKALTGGFLPLALTIANDKIYNNFLSNSWEKALLHGHSYTANPISCAASIKSLEILNRIETISNIKKIESIHASYLPKICNVFNKRQKGTIAAFDVQDPEKASQIRVKMLENGLIIRPIGKTIYIIPPYCINPQDLEIAYNTLINLIK